MEEKKAIRKQIFAARKACSAEQIEQNSQKITKTVTQMPLFQEAEKIYIYADYNNEVITRYIIEEAWRQKKEVAVPKVVGEHMVFYRLTEFSQLEEGYFHIPEPVRGETVMWEEGLMVMPGVAFDTNNHRVGYGGGFYDRFLEKHPKLDTIAVAFEFQILPEVPWEKTDIRPDYIVTEERVIAKEG